ncbi:MULTISPECIES: phosphoribosyltransferase [unclassified Myxococcus]|uniref:phosphoribosyltransferase n=1 Tax=unclassified Myxococcus TaxID=2648731 RepID=UPI0011478A86|nr:MULTISPECIES: phosphoribosyltransferase [unclassified Myxococcus]
MWPPCGPRSMTGPHTPQPEFSAVATKRQSKSTEKASSKKSPAVQAEKLVSIPADVVLAPQVEAPRQPTGKDQSRSRSASSGVKELSWKEFDRAVQQLAGSIQETFEPQVVVGVAHGGVFVGGALAGALGCPFFPVRISRRSRDRGSAAPRTSKTPQLAGEMPAELKGRRVLIVDDVASSGDTLELASALAREAGAKKVATACLVTKPGGFSPDYSALSTASLMVFPWDYEPSTGDARFDEDPDKAGA